MLFRVLATTGLQLLAYFDMQDTEKGPVWRWYRQQGFTTELLEKLGDAEASCSKRL